MGIRVHTAIGYAMPWGDFFRYTLLNINPRGYLGDELDQALETFKGLVYDGDEYIWKVIDDGHIAPIDQNPSSLVGFVGQGDRNDHVMFWPTAGYKKEWCRFNDTLDYHFAEREGIEEYLADGFYPFHELRMDDNGVDVSMLKEHDSRYLIDHDPTLRPGIPEVLRWWLLHCGVFDLRGIAALRPMKAQWWG